MPSISFVPRVFFLSRGASPLDSTAAQVGKGMSENGAHQGR